MSTLEWEMSDGKDQLAQNSTPLSARVAQDYLERRLKPQLGWYENRSKQAKIWYRGLTGAQLIATTAIPVVNILTHSIVASSVLAGVAALATGFTQIAQHHEHWLTFRQAANALEAIRMRYEIGLSPFQGDDKHDVLVAETEKILSDENMKWTSLAGQQGQIQPVTTTIIGR